MQSGHQKLLCYSSRVRTICKISEHSATLICWGSWQDSSELFWSIHIIHKAAGLINMYTTMRLRLARMCHHISQFLALDSGISCSSRWPTWFVQDTGLIGICSWTVLNFRDCLDTKGKVRHEQYSCFCALSSVQKWIDHFSITFGTHIFGSNTKVPVKVHRVRNPSPEILLNSGDDKKWR